MRYAASSEQADIIFAHAAEKVGRGLKCPFEFHAGCEDAAGDFKRAGKLDREVGVEEGHFFGSVARDQVDHLRDDAVGRESIESTLVENLVGAVVACVRAADAGSVGKFANAAELFVGVEVREIEGRNGKRVERFYFAVDVMGTLSVVLP